MAKRLILALVATLSVVLPAASQTAPKVARVGFCGGFGMPEHIFHKTFVEAMRKRGWEEGRNVEIIVPLGTVKDGIVTRSCKEYMADKALDVLVDGDDDPASKIPRVGSRSNVTSSGLAKSATRNVTGISTETPENFQAKRMQLLKEATGAQHIFFLYARPPGPKVKPGVGSAEDLPLEFRNAAAELGISIAPVNFTVFEDFEPAFKAIAAKPRAALIFHTGMYWYKITRDNVGIDHFLAKHKLPVLMPQPDWVHTNEVPPTLIAYGTSFLEAIERKAYFVDRILRGAKPAELPFEQISPRLAINLDAAKYYGIELPRSILLQADRIVPYDPRFDWLPPKRP